MEKTYISPDIIVVEMGNNLMALNAISQADRTNAAPDSGKDKTDVPGIGPGVAPEDSKDNAFDPWSTWDD